MKGSYLFIFENNYFIFQCSSVEMFQLNYFLFSGPVVYVMDIIDRVIYKMCPFVAGGIFIGTVYWTMVTYGAVTVMQVNKKYFSGLYIISENYSAAPSFNTIYTGVGVLNIIMNIYWHSNSIAIASQ